ncbi:MAG: amino acid adenylation domain-containing protein, partial [Oscillochloris sp.]|nr:amino acid adenylation domain-containing protein [Oscillochloris sp.]
RTGYVAPSGEVELTIAALWEQVLGIEQIGIYDDFFELGGHSLLATQMISRLRERYNVELPLRNLFDAPTVAGLAVLIVAGQAQALAPASSAIIRLPRESALPLSHIQQRMWFLDQLEPGSPLYNNPGAVRLRGALDLAALERSLVEIVRRHEVLRTTFGEEDGQPLPVVASVEAAAHIALLQLSDLSGLPESAREAELQRLAQAESQAHFDLERGPLLRLALLRLAADDHVALLTMHHIVSDGWSLGVFIRELGALYAAFTTGQPSPLPELSVQYADVAAWQREILEQPGADGVSLREAQSDYWRRELGGDLPALELPTDRPRPQMQSFRGAMRWFNLPRQLNDAVAELCRREDVTPFMALLAAFEALLHRYTGQSCFGVGTPIAGRTRTEAEPLIGIFVNTLVLRADLDAELRFRELLRQVRERALGAYANQELPFEMLVDALQPERSLSHTPLFQVMFVLQNAPMQAIALPGLSIAPLEVDSGTAKFDLTLSVEESVQGYRGWLNYNADLFDAATMDRLLDHFALLLASACAEPSQTIAMLPLLTEAEQQILAAWNATDSGDLLAPLVHQVIARQAVLTPDAIAVVGDDSEGLRLSYRELDARANQLAHYLRGLGVGPERLVGLCVERTPLMLVGLLGILKAGGGYLPLDPGYPVERLHFMIEDAAPAVLLTTLSAQAGLADIEQLTAAPQLVRLDADWPVIADQPERAPEELVRPESLAYVIYTSGSTGTPKGVVIEQQSLADHCRDMARFYELSSADRVLQFASFNFDASIEQILPTLMAGARLVLRGDEVWSSAEFYRQITEQQLTVINPPTAYWHQLVQDWADGPQAQAPTSLRLVIVGGDALRPESLQLRAKTSLRSLRLLNAYGPTETTITATTYEVPAELPPDLLRVPIGRPLANRRAFVLDRQGSLVPIGVAGELYLGGLGVARGYLNRPELTAERFVEREGMRLYRTGDLVRYLSDGNIEFLGRVDQQVKLRGFRIELGEIEAVLGQHPAVRGVIVLAREDTPGDKRLVAYVLAQPDTPADGASLRAYLSQRLPDYMLPSAFVILDAFPLTPSGKVDRRALPAPDAARPELIERYVAPRNPSEAEIATAWADVLGLEQIGIHDNFFELGGHSLLATRLVSRLRSFFHVDLPLRSLFETPTVAGVAIAIAQAQADQTDDDELAALLAELEELSDEEASHQLATERGGPTD